VIGEITIDHHSDAHDARAWFNRAIETMPVDAHMIADEREGNVVQNLRRKEADAERMLAAMVMHTRDLSSLAIRGQVRDTPSYNPQMTMEIPKWL